MFSALRDKTPPLAFPQLISSAFISYAGIQIDQGSECKPGRRAAESAECRLSMDTASLEFPNLSIGAWVSRQTVWVTPPLSSFQGMRMLEAQLLQNVNHTDCPELLTCLKP